MKLRTTMQRHVVHPAGLQSELWETRLEKEFTFNRVLHHAKLHHVLKRASNRSGGGIVLFGVVWVHTTREMFTAFAAAAAANAAAAGTAADVPKCQTSHGVFACLT
jgi:hypothetical protein